MLWSKEKTSESSSYVELFSKISPNITSSETGTAIHDELEAKEFKKRLKHYDKKFAELAKERREDGKKLFGKKDYVNAMKEFNRCLMFAQPDSVEIGLAYANRSACFFYMNMPNECLVDIELAKKSNYPNDLMDKLDNRASKCNNLEREDVKPLHTPIREPLLSFKEHEQFAGVAECLEINKNDEFGLHVITKSDLKIGQTILLERPFSIVPTKFCTQNRDRCFYCFRKLRNFMSCEDCLVGFYCDMECMTKAHHKMECNMEIFSSEKEKIQLVVKTFLNINAIFSDVDGLIKTINSLLNGNEFGMDDLSAAQKEFCSLFQLELHCEKYTNERKDAMTEKSKIAYDIVKSFPDIKERYATEEQQRFVQHLIHHLCYMVERAIDLQDYVRANSKSPLASYSFEHYAKAMYPFASYIRHSCIPNVCWFSVDDRLVCKVIQPIKSGEQIFRSHL